MAFGQGQVQFRNWLAAPAIDAAVYLDTVGGAKLNGTDTMWRAALIGGAVGSTTALASSLNGYRVGSMATLANSAGTLSWVNFRTGATPPVADGYVTTSTVGRVIPGVDWGGSAVVQMVAWQGNFTTWADAFAAAQLDPLVKIGASNPLTLALPTSATDPNLAYLVGLQSFAIASVAPIPEPSTFALAGLAGAAMLIFRRRK